MAARHRRYSADKCVAQLCFFFAAGAFTGRLDTFAIASLEPFIKCGLFIAHKPLQIVTL